MGGAIMSKLSDKVSSGGGTQALSKKLKYGETWTPINTDSLVESVTIDGDVDIKQDYVEVNSIANKVLKRIDLENISKFPISTITDSFSSPSTVPFGLTYDGTNLISCDDGTDKIYIHDGKTSTITDSFSSPSTLPSGLTYDGTNLISCDYNADKIYIHDGKTSTITDSFSSPSMDISGLTYDGTNLISCDYNADKIYIHDGKTSTIIDSFSSPSTLPFGLTYDGTNLISCDYNADKIYIHDNYLPFSQIDIIYRELSEDFYKELLHHEFTSAETWNAIDEATDQKVDIIIQNYTAGTVTITTDNGTYDQNDSPITNEVTDSVSIVASGASVNFEAIIKNYN
jgi:hypothetical protein